MGSSDRWSYQEASFISEHGVEGLDVWRRIEEPAPLVYPCCRDQLFDLVVWNFCRLYFVVEECLCYIVSELVPRVAIMSFDMFEGENVPDMKVTSPVRRGCTAMVRMPAAWFMAGMLSACIVIV